jgi:hypothetical protein
MGRCGGTVPRSQSLEPGRRSRSRRAPTGETSARPPGRLALRALVEAATIVQCHSPRLRNPNLLTVAIGNLRPNLEALFCPRLKVGVRKFGKLAPLKLLAVSQCCCLVS